MRILAIGAHCDDVELGCGGTLAKHVEAGDQVGIFHLSSDHVGEDAAQSAAKVLGIPIDIWNLEDQKFDEYPFLEIVQGIEEHIKGCKPDIVFTHWTGDLNRDHQLTAQAVLTACRPLPNSTVKAIYGYEVVSSTEWGAVPFVPTHFEQLSIEHMQKKKSALECYGEEIKPSPHARSINAIHAMNVKRGAEAGVYFAEAFHVYRSIRRI